MTASPLVTVFCDAPSCGEWEEAGIGATATEARAGLRGRGWTLNVPDPDHLRTRRDYCPRHHPPEPQPPPPVWQPPTDPDSDPTIHTAY